ncbi:hypothetical protein M3Y98_01170100 [Aphelenchoides besseyi]|nr:hypothetical protein M3Y98_01170100 [Aphelenchoides besseyi]KAI6210962.1 hypothetical protein M3Y96_00383100 [Aphelenchoides besseyi]
MSIEMSFSTSDFWSSIAAEFGFLVMFASTSFLLTLCAGKQNPSKLPPATAQPKYVSKTCNKKSGLLNDDPDLKSDKIVVAARPGAGAVSGNVPPSDPTTGTTGANLPPKDDQNKENATGSKDQV